VLLSSTSSLVICICLYLIFFVFFFQAEDGIRDDLVTGVQTCALPISPGCLPAPASAPIGGRTGRLLVREGNLVRANSPDPLVVRSEERRVGKECRGGWARAELTKTRVVCIE